MYSEEIEERLRKAKIETGNTVKVKTSKGTFEGILMPRSEAGDSDILVIKRADGYNMGLKLDAKSSIENIQSRKEHRAFPKKTVIRNKSLPKVALLYTGGTIGSKVDYTTGGVHVLTEPGELLNDIPELEGITDIEVNDIMHTYSEDMSYLEWQAIAKGVFDAFKKGARGVVITCGTDTMHYTSAALSFMLNGINGPVVITGAQRSSDRGSSDAFMNVICSVQIAAKSDAAELGICMHSDSSDNTCSFIRGTKARKMHTSRRDAFKPINSRLIAKVNIAGNIEYLSNYKKISDKSKNWNCLTDLNRMLRLSKCIRIQTLKL